jgi:hypothetical protein
MSAAGGFDLCRSCFQGLGSPPANQHVHTFPGQGFGAGFAQPLARCADDSGLSSQFQIHGFSSRIRITRLPLLTDWLNTGFSITLTRFH